MALRTLTPFMLKLIGVNVISTDSVGTFPRLATNTIKSGLLLVFHERDRLRDMNSIVLYAIQRSWY